MEKGMDGRKGPFKYYVSMNLGIFDPLPLPLLWPFKIGVSTGWTPFHPTLWRNFWMAPNSNSLLRAETKLKKKIREFEIF